MVTTGDYDHTIVVTTGDYDYTIVVTTGDYDHTIVVTMISDYNVHDSNTTFTRCSAVLHESRCSGCADSASLY